MTIYDIYAEEENILQQGKEYIVNFLKKAYIYEFTKGGCFIVRKGNEYFHLVAEETFGGGVRLCLTSGIKERPYEVHFSHFYGCNTSYSIERGRKYMKEYIEGLQLHCGLSATGAAVLGFN